MEQRIAALETELRKTRQDMFKAANEAKTLKDENTQLEDDLSDAKDEIKMLSQDMELKQKELELEIGSNKRLQEDIKELEQQPEEYQHSEELVNSLNDKTKQCAELETQLHTAEQQIEQGKATIEKLKGRIWGLKDERDLKEPLVQVGVAIRRQFLIQAREKCFRGSITKSDAEDVKRGYAAAYEGDGTADEALLLAGYLDMQEWKEVTSSLYGAAPGEFAGCYQGYQRARNCWVAVQAVQPGRGACPCFKARSEVERRTAEIFKEYEKDGDAAEGSSTVQSSIAKVERLTKEIMESVRGPAGLIFPVPEEELSGSNS